MVRSFSVAHNNDARGIEVKNGQRKIQSIIARVATIRSWLVGSEQFVLREKYWFISAWKLMSLQR